MALVFVQRYAPTAVTLVYHGTQYIAAGKTLAFDGATTIVLASSLFADSGQYVIFDYSAAGASFPGSQGALDTNVFPYIDDSALAPKQAVALVDDTANKQVILTIA